MNLFSKKMPAWLLLAALVVVGAGAATGLVLKDQINGTTTIAVSQAIRITGVTEGGDSDADEFLGTVDDDGMAWAAHFEANNGDYVELDLALNNFAGADNEIVCLLTLDDIPAGMTINMEASEGNIVRISENSWKFDITSDGDDLVNDQVLTITIALEDAQPTGFYEISSVIVPLNY